MIKCLLAATLPLFSFCVLAQSQSGAIYLSADNGETWRRIDKGLPADAIVNDILETKGLVMAATENHGIYLSDDQLQTWHAANKGLPVKKVDALHVFQGQIFAGTFREGVFLSDDNGYSWHPFSDGLTDLTIRSFFTFQNRILVGTNDGIYVLEGTEWKQICSGFQVNDFAQLNDKLFVATSRGVMISTPTLSDWKLILKDTAIHTFSKMKEIIAGFTYNAEVVNIDAKGIAWVNSFPGVPQQLIYSITSTGGYFLAHMQDGLFKSTDFGKTWDKIKSSDLDRNLKMIINTKFGLIAGRGNNGC